MSVDAELVEVVRASYQRCCTAPDFFEAFYRNFFTACPEAEARFANTDFERQNKLLRHAFGLLLIFPKQPESEPTLLTRLAERHSRRDLDVHPSLYPLFVNSLVATVKQYDPEFTPEIEDAWRTTVAQGIAYMKSKY